MKLLIIRHGEPDYVHDSLKPRGFREAELLALKLKDAGITQAYVSPLGRAQATAAPTLKALGLEAPVLEWLREFPAGITPEYAEHAICPWELPPTYCETLPHFLTKEWYLDKVWAESDVPSVYERIGDSLDALLAENGYIRKGTVYAREKDGDDTVIALFCHMGLGLALVAHLTGIPLPVAWHHFFLAPSSVTTVGFERHPYAPAFSLPRILSLSDTSHLYGSELAPSQSGLLSRC